MKHTGQAIRDAAEKGGYQYRWWKVNDLEYAEGYNALQMRGLMEHMHDSDFWKALAKARGCINQREAKPNCRAIHVGVIQL